MGTTYATATTDREDAELHQHLVSDAAGRCLVCREHEPCIRRQILARVLTASGRLPRRRPGVLGHAIFHTGRTPRDDASAVHRNQSRRQHDQ